MRLGTVGWIGTQGLKEIVHTALVVKLVTPRLIGALGFGPFMVLHDDGTGELGSVQRWRGHTQSWPPPLAAAGFEVEKVATWFSFTGEPGWGKAPPVRDSP